MTLAFDVFWSFRSPYSYLALHQLEALRRDWDVTINARPVLPIAVRIDGFFKKANPLWLPYLVRDTIRTAEFLMSAIIWRRRRHVRALIWQRLMRGSQRKQRGSMA